MKKHNLDPAYGEESAARTGLVLSMGEVPDPVPLAPEDIEWPSGYAPHYGVHQMDWKPGVVDQVCQEGGYDRMGKKPTPNKTAQACSGNETP